MKGKLKAKTETIANTEAEAAAELTAEVAEEATAEAKAKAKAKAKAIATTAPYLYYTEIDSAIGLLTLCASEHGLCHIEFGSFADRADFLGKWADRYYPGAEYTHAEKALSLAATQLGEYFAGKRHSFDLPLDMRGTEFQRKVWKALLEIPYGTAVSYKSIAERIGQPKAVRAVGGANNKNPLPIVVPCHRVIGSGGALVGYGGGLSIKESLLSLERQHLPVHGHQATRTPRGIIHEIHEC